MEDFKMGIFTGIEMLFFWLGVISTLLTVALIKLNQMYNFKWYIWTLSITGAFLTIFTLAWTVSSILEGEPQAANMGLLVFGVPILLIFGVTRRLLLKKEAPVKP